MKEIDIKVNFELTNSDLNELFFSAWKEHHWIDFIPMLSKSLVNISAFSKGNLIGFVNVAWDGGIHAFLLNTTVHRDWQRMGIGKKIIERAVTEAKERKVVWIHVDYKKKYRDFYRSCGFQPTEAGLINTHNT